MLLIDNYKNLLNQKLTIVNFPDHFSNDDECLQLYFNLKFEGRSCSCGRSIVENYSRVLRKNKAFRCRTCRKYIYPLSDTVFRKSTIPLNQIFYVIFYLCISRSSVSAMYMTRILGTSYVATHRLMMLIRKVLIGQPEHKMTGVIEVDEAFLGKGSKLYNWSSISTRKQPIIGLIARETKEARLFLVDNRNAKTINRIIWDNVEFGSTIYTDSWKGYSGLSQHYKHEMVYHASREFVRGTVHTNNIESVWGHFKRNIRSAHIKITDKYVQEYVNEACWRHNSRGKSAMELFNNILVSTFHSGLD